MRPSSNPRHYLPLLLGLACLPLTKTRAAEVEQSTVGVAVHRSLYVASGVPETFPQLLVYSPTGRCLGTLGEDAMPNLDNAVEGLLQEPTSLCTVFQSTAFGSEAPTAATGPGTITLQLLVLDVPFCAACDRMHEAFLSLTDQRPSYRFLLTRVSLDRSHNKGLDKHEPCESCGSAPAR